MGRKKHKLGHSLPLASGASASSGPSLESLLHFWLLSLSLSLFQNHIQLAVDATVVPRITSGLRAARLSTRQLLRIYCHGPLLPPPPPPLRPPVDRQHDAADAPPWFSSVVQTFLAIGFGPVVCLEVSRQTDCHGVQKGRRRRRSKREARHLEDFNFGRQWK